MTIIDLKMRRQSQLKRFSTSNKPTRLYQIDDLNLLVGTEGGKIEHWTFSDKTCKKIYEAHPESDAGISEILELKTNNELLRGSPNDDSFKLIATASEGASQFRLWKLHLDSKELFPYLKIETTFTNGIKYLLETHDTQLAAADEKTIKFYDFIDKNDKEANEKIKQEKEQLQQQMKTIFLDLDKEKCLKLKKDDIRKYFNHLAIKISSTEFQAVNKVDDECFNDVWAEFDTNEAGFMSWHLIKPMIKRLLEH